MEEPLAAFDPLPSDAVVRHWLLNLVAEFGVLLNRLFPRPEEVGMNVRPVPGFSSADCARCLADLFDSGLITLSSEFPEDDVTTRSGVSRILDRFLALPRDYQRRRYLRSGDATSVRIDQSAALDVTFKLTALGGEAWEEVAEPDWARFISAFSTSDEVDADWHGDLVSPDRDLLIAYMGWYPEVNHEKIRLETIKWETHTDFEVLYWKRLPFVYHASFQAQTAEARWNHYQVPSWFWDWWSNTTHWYKKPWDLPSWPG